MVDAVEITISLTSGGEVSFPYGDGTEQSVRELIASLDGFFGQSGSSIADSAPLTFSHSYDDRGETKWKKIYVPREQIKSIKISNISERPRPAARPSNPWSAAQEQLDRQRAEAKREPAELVGEGR